MTIPKSLTDSRLFTPPSSIKHMHSADESCKSQKSKQCPQGYSDRPTQVLTEATQKKESLPMSWRIGEVEFWPCPVPVTDTG